MAATFTKRHPDVGARPGTLVLDENALPPKAKSICYSPTEIHEHDLDDAESFREAFDPSRITWIDVQGFGDKRMMQDIGKMFELHPLLLEDIVNVPQRPKVETYGDQLLIIVRMVRVSDEGEIDMEQVSLVVAEGYVLTFQEKYGDVLDPVRQRLRNGKARLRKFGSDYLAYAIIDTIVDGYYPMLESIGNLLEELEDAVTLDPTTQLLRRLNRTKAQLVDLRRGIWPQREAVSHLARGDEAIISDEVRIFFRDTYDHCVQTSEVTEMYREMATGLMSMYLSAVANKTNEVMKVLTIMASIFIPLTFMAGIYGMNFENMPELHYAWAYPMLMASMFLTAGGMIYYFWRKGWIFHRTP